MVQDKPLRTSWQRKMKERQERKLTKDFARHLEEEKQRRRQVTGHLAKSGSQRPNTCMLSRHGLLEYDLELWDEGPRGTKRSPGPWWDSHSAVQLDLWLGHAGDMEVERGAQDGGQQAILVAGVFNLVSSTPL